MAKEITHPYSSIIDSAIEDMLELVDGAIADDHFPYEEDEEENFNSLSDSALKYIHQQITKKVTSRKA